MSHYQSDLVASLFDEYGTEEWQRLVRSPVAEVKLYIHTHYLQTYVPPGSRVLEVGAGPGRFTQILAERGCTVTVTDISPVQLDLNRRYARELGFASQVAGWLLLDVCDMSILPAGAFDAVVCYGGPLSYVFDRAGAALHECARVMTPSGVLLLGVMSLWGSVHAHLGAILGVPRETNESIIRTGDDLIGKHRCHLFRAAELRGLIERSGLTVLDMSASNCLSMLWEERLSEIRQDEARWQELLGMELEASRQPGCLDMGTHLIAVARKAS